MLVVLVIGLPGSGKTSWARQRIAEAFFQGHRQALIDDPTDLGTVASELAKARAAGAEVVYVCDPNFCAGETVRAAQEWFQTGGYDVESVYFQNDPQQCLRNAMQAEREHKAVHGAILMWARVYAPPEDALPVHEIC